MNEDKYRDFGPVAFVGEFTGEPPAHFVATHQLRWLKKNDGFAQLQQWFANMNYVGSESSPGEWRDVEVVDEERNAAPLSRKAETEVAP